MDFSPSEDYNDESLTRFESMLKTNNVFFFDSIEFENIIQHYLEIGKIALAKKAIKMGLDQHISSVTLKLFQVEIYVLENKLEKADSLLNVLHTLEPSNEEVYIQKASIFSKQDEHQKAIDTLLIALEMCNTDNDKADLFALLGMEYLFLDQFENAKNNFIKCLEIDLHDYSALYNIVYCFEFLEENEDAILFLNDYLNKNPYCEVAWHQLGKQYVHTKELKKALAAFDFAIYSDDSFVGAYIEKGKVLEKLNRYPEAIDNYKITLALEEPTSFALLRIGKCFERLNNDDMAVQYYFKTVHEDPMLDKGWIAITKFYLQKRNYRKALYYINKAINIDQDNVNYWKLFAQINQRLHYFEEAERGYKRTLELGNYELDTWLSRADILISLGEFEAAIYSLEQTEEFYPETPEVVYRLAGLFYTTMQSDKGKYYLKNGLKLDPEYFFILDELFPRIATKPSVANIISTAKNCSN
ncbi:MAG: hypothetical protein BM564_05430 [Bacteroidetes bacterium MedPE-SWsnd-G2]|mgnify:CR=1 FL=1|nr:MAG: hypothetical protein BM564_05430 [Bacteroidetes bacterium MedPE-SWsnd-G2]